MRIIPAIDIIEGKCVRLTQGDYAQKKIYNENPLDVAKAFEDAGVKYLHLVDLDGAKAGSVTNWDVISTIASKTSLVIDFGGGVKTEEEITRLLDSGVKQINLGSIAVNNPLKVYAWVKRFGSDKIILSADVKNEIIAINGWQQNSSINITDYINDFHRQGVQYITCTDISTDGMLSGPNIILYQKLITLFPKIRLIASGGVSSSEDIEKLNGLGLDGVIIGKALYENKITVTDLQKLLTVYG